jgi:superfamily II DNA or RNA helicase
VNERIIQLRPHQVRARDALLGSARGIIKVPAGGGKTIVAAAALASLPAAQQARLSVLWLANTREQCTQADDALDLFGLRERHAITVRCAAGGYRGERPDVLIVDECHHAGADEWRATIEQSGAPIRWGLSATPERADERASIVYQVIGPVLIVVDRQELTDAGHLTHARVVFHNPVPKGSIEAAVEREAMTEFARQMKRWPWLNRDEIRNRCIWTAAWRQGIVECQERNNDVLRITRGCLEEGRNTLVLVGTVDHGKMLASHIPGAALCHAKVGKKARREMIEGTRNGDIRCLFATSLADEGLDIPRLNALVLVTGGRSAAKMEQRTGRVLRSFETQEDGLIHDFRDEHHYFLHHQARARCTLYKRLGYTVVLP